MFDESGKQAWAAELDIYGTIKNLQGENSDCPFRYPGQYEDSETGLYYNRFRYYDAEAGGYVSQDPIKLSGGDRLYGYVRNTNTDSDIFGLNFLQDLANDAASTLSPRTQGAVVVAVGSSDDGKLFVSTSEKRVRGPIREWAEKNGVELIDSLQDNIHAEEALVKAKKGITAIEPTKDVCIDCEKLMKDNDVKFERPTTGKKSNSRKSGGKYSCS